MKPFRFASVSFYLTLAAFVVSCSAPQRAPVAPAMMPVTTEDPVDNQLPWNGPEAVEKKRTGIATGWGREVDSKMTYTGFVRSAAKPSGISLIRYNSADGAKGMGVDRGRKGKGMQRGGGGLVEWGMSSGLVSLENTWWRGDRFVIGKKGREYQITVKNITDARLEVVLSVDGLDVMDGQPASVKKRGYIVGPGKKITIKGFRTSEDKIATFKFSSVGASYANLRHGDTRNVGVVGLAVFTEKGREPGAEGRRRGAARPFAEAPQVKGR